MSKEKYRQFMNYLHNELGISKEDIKEWTKEAVTEVAQNYVDNQFSKRDLDSRLERIILRSSGFLKGVELRDAAARMLADRIEFSIREKEEPKDGV